MIWSASNSCASPFPPRGGAIGPALPKPIILPLLGLPPRKQRFVCIGPCKIACWSGGGGGASGREGKHGGVVGRTTGVVYTTGDAFGRGPRLPQFAHELLWRAHPVQTLCNVPLLVTGRGVVLHGSGWRGARVCSPFRSTVSTFGSVGGGEGLARARGGGVDDPNQPGGGLV